MLLLLVLGILMHSARGYLPTTDGVGAGTELAFGFLLLAAFFGGKVFARLRSPQVTGYIVVGAVAGPYVLKLVSIDMVEALRIVNGVAVCLIALTAGAELSIEKMRPLLRTIRSMTVWAVLGTSLLLAATLYGIHAWDAAGPPVGPQLLPFFDGMSTPLIVAVCFMLAVTLASQSPAVVMALLNETKADGPVSQITLAVVVIADLVVIVLYGLASSVTSAFTGEADVLGTVAKISWELFGSAGIGVFIGILLATFLRYVKRGASLFVVLVCFVVAEVGLRLHLDPLIVTLIAGVYIENVSRVDAHKFIHDLEAASLPVYLVFFALAGASLDLGLLYAVLIPAALLAVIRGLGFWLGCRRAGRVTEADDMVVRWAWVGLLPQAGLALALALFITTNFEGFGVQASALILGVVGLNQVVTPVLLRIALIRSGEAGRREMPELLHDQHDHDDDDDDDGDDDGDGDGNDGGDDDGVGDDGVDDG